MSRGLPISILVHVVVLAVLAAYGSYVPQPPLEPRRVLRVQLQQMPQVQPQVTQPAPEPEAQPPVQEPPREQPQKPQPPPELAPKEVPEPVRQEPAAKPSKPEPERPRPREEPAPAEATDAPADAPTAAGPALSGTDVDFPFAWYLNRVESIIATKWNPRQLGFREGSARRCVVHFLVGRGGQVTGVTLVESSGVALFDREALRAVKASRLPPLPAKFTAGQLGVTFIFTLQSGI